MKPIWCIGLLLFASSIESVTQSSNNAIVVPGEYLVRRAPGVGMQQLLSSLKAKYGDVELIEEIGGPESVVHVRLPIKTDLRTPNALAAELSSQRTTAFSLAAVEAIEPVVSFRLAVTANDAARTELAISDLVKRIDFDTLPAGSMSATAPQPVVVAVIDTGVMLEHEIFKGLLLPGVDVTTEGNGNSAAARRFPDGSMEYHGTGVAGLIALMIRGGKVDGPPLANVKLLPIRATTSATHDQRVLSSAAIKAMEIAIQRGARIINTSWGDFGESDELKQKFAEASQSGILVFAAAGNGQREAISQPFRGFSIDKNVIFPAGWRFPNLISVTALAIENELARFSNWGPKNVQLAAPGENVTVPTPLFEESTNSFKSGYVARSGTSLSTPLVAGGVAIYIATHPNTTNADLVSLLSRSVKKEYSLGQKVSFGGRLSVASLWTPRSVTTTANLEFIQNVMRKPPTWSLSSDWTAAIEPQTQYWDSPTLRGLDAGGKTANTKSPISFLVRLEANKDNPDSLRTFVGKAGWVEWIEKISPGLYAVKANATTGSEALKRELMNMPTVVKVERVKAYELQ